MTLSYSAIQSRLDQLDSDLADKQDEFERAASSYFGLKRDWELAYARTYAATDKTLSATERKQETVLAINAAGDLHERYGTAEGRWEGLRAAVRVIETRVSIGQSLLKSMIGVDGRQPEWSQAA